MFTSSSVTFAFYTVFSTTPLILSIQNNTLPFVIPVPTAPNIYKLKFGNCWAEKAVKACNFQMSGFEGFFISF